MAELTLFLPPFFPPPEIPSFWGTSIAITPSGTQKVLLTLVGEVFDWVISSDFLPLNDLDILTLLHRSSGSRSSPDISFTLSSLALSCSWEVLQDLGSDHLPIVLSVSVLITYQFFYLSLSLSLQSFAPTSIALFLQFLESSLG